MSNLIGELFNKELVLLTDALKWILESSWLDTFLPFLWLDRSAVIDIRVVNVTANEMQLKWENTDSAPGYKYHIVLEPECGPNKTTTSQKWITLKGLTPGTLYNVTISPELGHVQGDSSSIAQYTRESWGPWGWAEGVLLPPLTWRKCRSWWSKGWSCSGFHVDVGAAELKNILLSKGSELLRTPWLEPCEHRSVLWKQKITSYENRECCSACHYSSET